MSPVVVLVGPPGSGKSTVGALVAQRLGADFRDSDADIEASTGMEIGEIFFDRGEAHFRELERAAVGTALAEAAGVLALGGGAIADSQTRAALAEQLVVFLEVDLHDAVTRVGFSRDRPLNLPSPRAQLKRLLDERRPLYLEVATATVSTTDRTVEQVTLDVLAAVRAVSSS